MNRLHRFFDERPWLTQRGVAEKAGIRENLFSNYCNGLRVREEHREPIAAALTECTGKPVAVAELWPETQEAGV